jgi:predicted transcriptional regulator
MVPWQYRSLLTSKRSSANSQPTGGRHQDELAQEAIDSYLEAEFRFTEAVKLGEAELERGEYLTHEEVGARIDKLFRS